MVPLNVLWVIALFSCDVFGMDSNSREKPKTEGRQLQSFFPQGETSSPNFQPSPSDVYFVDGNNQVQDTKPKQQFHHNPKFSPNLQADLYNSQLPQHQLQQQQIQQQQINQQQIQQIQQQQYQYAQQTQPQYTKPSRPVYPTPDGNEVNFGEVPQKYSQQSQQYVDNSNFIYTEPPQFQSQSPYEQGYSQIVTGDYVVGNRPQVNIPPQQRPTYSLYNQNHQQQYGGNSRPIYQSQQNFNLRPPSGYGNGNEGGGIMESISNFISNIGQGASELFSNRPPINQYSPPPTVSAGLANRPQNSHYNQQTVSENQQYAPAYSGPQFGQNGGNPVNQFSKAIEEITRNDDYQCIPKVICQMVGSQRRQPSLLSSPIFTAIISAVPSTSAGLVYGRAALLGLISGEQNCHTAYPKCPRNEDDLLYYLNNHRGGFFRFFNGGAAFGDEQNYQQQNYQQQNYQHNPNQFQYQPQYHQTHQSAPPPQQQSPDDGSLQTNLAALQNIASAINSGDGINLSNLGANSNLFSGLAGLLNGGGSSSNTGSGGGFDLSSLASNAGLLGNLASLVGSTMNQSPPSKAPPDDQGQSLTELVGNLLTGFVGQRFAGRKIHKRSIVTFDDEQNSTDFSEDNNEIYRNLPKKISAFKLKLAASKLKFPEQSKFKFPEELHEAEEEDDKQIEGVEGRILNSRPSIHANDDEDNHRFVFDSNRDSKNVNFVNRITGPTPLPNYNGNSQSDSQIYFNNNQNNDEFRIASNHRAPKLMKFQDDVQQSGPNYSPFFQQDAQDSVRFDTTSINRPSKMIFPDRTGTGNLRFDHDEYTHGNRYGKILSYGNQRPQNNDANRVTFGQTDRFSTEPHINYSNNRQHNQNTNYYNQNYPTLSHNRYSASSSNRQRDEHSSQNIYITNGEGKIVYYINAQGKKVYV